MASTVLFRGLNLMQKIVCAFKRKTQEAMKKNKQFAFISEVEYF